LVALDRVLKAVVFFGIVEKTTENYIYCSFFRLGSVPNGKTEYAEQTKELYRNQYGTTEKV